MSPTVYALIVVVGIVVVALALGLGADCLTMQCVRKKIEKLRKDGVIPPDGQGTDEGIVKLANEGKRDQAALYYVAVHGGRIEQARVIVGAGASPTSLMLVVFSLFVCFCAIQQIYTPDTDVSRLPILVAYLIVALLIWWKWRKVQSLVKKNRETVAAGKLPEPCACAKPCCCCGDKPKDDAKV